MNKIILLATPLLLLGVAASAQKLSPSAEIALMKSSNRAAFKSPADSAQATAVMAFVKVNSPSAADDIERLGGRVSSRMSQSELTATIPLSVLREVAQLESVDYVQAGTEARLLMDKARADAGVDKSQQETSELGAFTGKGVVVGIVDNGFEYGHIDFYNREGSETRIKRVWDQNSMTGNAPDGYGYGTEYGNFNELLARRTDMSSTYHGSHVTGIAAGSDMKSKFYGVAPDADIVLVSFKNDNVAITDAIKYIFDYADEVGKPCVVNISLGSHFGPHDGTSASDRIFDQITGPGRIIVGAAGNEGTYNLHASKTLTAEDKELKTMIGYENESSTNKQAMLDIWGSANKAMTVKCVVVDVLRGKIVDETDEVSSSEPGSYEFSFDTSSGVSGNAGIAISVDPVNHKPNASVLTQLYAAASNRRLGVVVSGDEGSEIHIWNNAYGNLLSGNKRGWTGGDSNYTVGELGGTGRSVISVGSYNTKNSYTAMNGDVYQLNESLVGTLSDRSSFSSIGPTADGRMKPDVAAPGAGIVSAASKYSTEFSTSSAAGATSANGETYYYGINVGTSMASPFVAGTVALWLQANPSLTPAEVRDIIKRSSRRDSFTGPASDTDYKWGAGKIDAYAGLELASNMTGIADSNAMEGLFEMSTDSKNRTVEVRFADQAAPAFIDIFDSTGRKVASETLTQSGQRISLGQLPRGIYLMKLHVGNNIKTLKTAF